MCPGFSCAYHVIIEIHCEMFMILETFTGMLHKARVLTLHTLGNVFSLNLFFPTASDSRSIQLFWVTLLAMQPPLLNTAFLDMSVQHIFLLHEISERLLVNPDFDFSFYSRLQFQIKLPLALVKDLVRTCSSLFFD